MVYFFFRGWFIVLKNVSRPLNKSEISQTKPTRIANVKGIFRIL